MSHSIFELCPRSPDEPLRWDAIVEAFDWVRAMAGVTQSPDHHAEGDVLTHVRMVVEELVASGEWRALGRNRQEELFAAALLHDVAKPECWAIDESGRITSRGHSKKGELRARAMLWRWGTARERRERICGIVRHHMVPFHLLASDHSERTALEVAERVSWEPLVVHARADARGRISSTRNEVLEQVELSLEYAKERDCAVSPFPFENDHSRFLYFRGERDRPTDPAWEEPSCTVTLMSGLPGSGKDSWIREHRSESPVVSLDAIRRRLGVDPTDDQGRVIQAAREAAREHLRNRRSFVWNATNVTRRVRRMPIGLFAEYGARVEIVSIEPSYERLLAQNAARADSVPVRVIERLLSKWEPPTRDEAHGVEWVEG